MASSTAEADPLPRRDGAADAELLNAVFRFKTQRPSATQSEALCRRLRDALAMRVDDILGDGDGSDNDRHAPLDAFTPQELVWLRRGCAQLQGEPPRAAVGDVWTIQWFPAYGGVLQAERVGVHTVALRVLALDQWAWTPHFLPSGECVDSAVPQCHVVLSCGQLPGASLGDVHGKIRDAMAAAAQITGTARTAAGSSAAVGHQKTPQFLVATVRTVVDATEISTTTRTRRMPRGGMTDVGLHTGGAARDTCWPLVCAALRQALPKYSALYDKVLLALHGALLDREVPVDGKQHFETASASSFWRTVDQCFEMLERVVDRATQLDQEGYDAKGILTKCEARRQRIDTVVAEWSQAQADKYTFPTQMPDRDAHTYQTLAAPDQTPFDAWKANGRHGSPHAFASGNSQYVLLEQEPTSAVDVLVFLESIEPHEGAKKLFGARLVEKFFFRHSTSLTEPVSRDALPQFAPEPLLDMMTWYQEHALKAQPHSDDTRRVEQQSVFVVLSWVAFCLAHRHCCDVFADVQHHKIALDWHGLEVCVLRELRCRTALRHVVQYIHDWNAQAEGEALFDLSHQEGTLAFARRMGQTLPVYQDLYLEVVSRFRVVCESQWAAIAARKASLELARQEIRSYSVALNDMKHNLKAAEEALRWEWLSRHPRGKPPRYLSNWQTQVFSEDIYRLTELIRQKTAFRDELIQMPEFAVSPLPANQEEALEILFLLSPPPPIENLAELCWRARRALTPPSSGIIEAAPSETCWLSHLEGIVGELPSAERAQYLSVFPALMEIPTEFGPMSIDDVSCAEAFAYSCVWFPNGSETTMLWQADQRQEGAWVNPFEVNVADSRRFFTPRLPVEAAQHGAVDGYQRWEWALSYPGDNGPDRGNMTYAEQRMNSDRNGTDQASSTLTSVGVLRSYPFQQLRRIFACVTADALQWSDDITKAVLRQALYQVGEIQANEDVQHSTTVTVMWHQDLADEVCVHQFSATLVRLIDKVKLSPRRWDCVPILSEIAAFLYQLDSSVKPLLLILARTTRTWAHEIREEWQRDALSDKDRSELRLRECVLYGNAVLCFHHLVEEEPAEDEVVELCELVVSFNHAKLFALDGKSAAVLSLVSQIECMMANRVVPIIQTINASPRKHHLLTHLARVVLPVVPDRVVWRQIQDRRSGGVSCCFVGVDDESGSSFGINLFTGAVTSNGGHPTSLPPSIRRLPLYEKLFDGRDFEVTYAGGVYETTNHLGLSCQYRFRVTDDSSDHLSVEEVSSDYTLQICANEWCDQLTQVLPARLGKLYSAWYWMKRQTVFLRGVRASDKAVYYVMRFDVDGTTRCYEVPRHDRLLSYATLMKKLREYPVLVVGDPVVLDILSKFEDPRYIHSLQQQKPPHTLEVSLPRFGLRFERQPNGRLASITHRGYVLSSTQQLCGQMLRFRQYMLLEKQDSWATTRRLVVPVGSVGSNRGTGLVEIECSRDPSASISFLSLDWHASLEVFRPETIEARLQLAAIYAASSNRVPWSDLRMTGGEAALQMLRGCSPSRPFSPTAAKHLVGIATRFSFGTPVLAVMVGVLLKKSCRLAFLFEEQQQEHPVVDFSDALDEYRHQHGSRQLAERVPVRQWLSHTELWDLLGSAEAADLVHARSPARTRPQGYIVDAWEDSAVATFVQECENELAAHQEQPGSVVLSTDGLRNPLFPLSPHGSNTISTRMLEDLQTSWSTFHRHHNHTITTMHGELVRTGARGLLDVVRAKRHDVKLFLEHALRQASNSVRDQLARTVSRDVDFTLADVMRSTVDEDFLRDVMPFSLEDDRMKWKDTCLGLLELCVLEDKLERIVAADADTDIVEELGTTRRSWKPAEHPYWLVFEVEGGLQIRDEQYVIAKHLLENPGSICQLNMGRGKTRVILPMLFLYHSYAARSAPRDGKLVRAHFLSPLLSETRELMWSVLTSSVLSLPFVELPFNRSCTLTHQDACMMRHVLTEAKRNGAVVMVAPEHRLSLDLELVELLNRHGGDDDDVDLVAEELNEILHPDNYIDIFDESDALLHHGYHLVYAVGASMALDGGATRWLTAEALLRVLISTQSKRVRKILQRYPDGWSTQAEYQERFGAGSGGGIYTGFRLHATRSQEADGEKMRSELRVALIEDLIDRPPFELEWLRLFSSNTGGVRASLVRLLTDASVDANEAMRRMPPGILHVKHQVLALRGFLAFNVLETCLEKRYRVEFGHPPAGSRRKQIAIPFQAADLPAERSEFSHPDVGIALTLLAFYHSGLSDAQLRRAFKVLLSLDESESIRYYDEWFSSVASQLQDPEGRAMLSSVEHISTDNAHQFAVLCRTYRFGIQVINFYVNFCVFPDDTRQFPHRLSRSAWDLARGSSVIGFSGTKDTHYLLPHGVEQREPAEPVLQGTDGKMIQLLLDATRGYEPLMGEVQDLEHRPTCTLTACWQSLLLLAVRKQSHALIDTGALLAGVSNHQAARFLVAQPDFAFQGVTYYDTRPQFDGWVVLEKDRDLLHHHHSSSLHERDTFVIFDEARARGSDMKQSPCAVALLTLGPGITKDKLMQGAGRMRLLGANQQTLWLTSTQDVFKSITSQAGRNGTSAADAVAVLNWVVDNTQRQCTLGLLEWAQSGIQFYTKNADPVHELQDDDWTLEGQYSAAQTQRLIADIIQSKLAKRSSALDHSGIGDGLGFGAIGSHGEVFGRQDAVFVTSFDEECEREVQIEEEQQQVSSAVDRPVTPCVEQAWNWCALLDARSVEALRAQDEIEVDIISLQDAARAWFLPLECGDVAWETSKIFATANFWSTVTTVDDDGDATDKPGSAFVWTSCLREVHAMVVFADASVLLLSEFEESAVLEMLQTVGGSDGAGGDRRRGCFGLVHLPFVVDALGRMEPSPPNGTSMRVSLRDIPLAIGWNKGQSHTIAKQLSLSILAVLTCCLLNGDTELFVARHAAPAEAALRTLLAPVRHREETLQSFVTLRGFGGRWKRSSLHAVARRMDLEAAMAPPLPLATKRRSRRG